MQDGQLTMRALSSPIRREILWRVWGQELPVATIVGMFELSPPTISGHLAVLRSAGLVRVRTDGTRRWYRADQDAVRRARDLLPGDPLRWQQGGGGQTLPSEVAARRSPAVALTVDAACSQEAAFQAFTHGELYGRWLGAPVRLVDRQFTATLESGLRVRGVYSYVEQPSLIVMSWDFDNERIPVPGEEQRATLVILPQPDGCRVELCQLASTEEALRYLERAWQFVLSRFAAGVVEALRWWDQAGSASTSERRPRSTNVSS